MDRLRDNALIYGRLLTVAEPHLVERYNKALTAFGLKPTKLTEFEIDRTGFSPQVAREFDDDLYLDPGGVNRRFIILTPMQEDLPVVHTRFSNTAQLMFEFLSQNRRAIQALTIRDVVYGEIEDNVAEVRSLDDLLAIEEVTFKVLSAEDVLGKAAELRTLIDRLETEPDFWRDDAALNHMVELATVTGDIRENRLVPDKVMFRHEGFWTSHFGGVYVFHDERDTIVIADRAAPGFRKSRPWQVSYIPIDDRVAVFNFLSETGRLDLPRASWTVPAGWIEHRLKMVLARLVADTVEGVDPAKVNDIAWMQTWKQRHASAIERDGRFGFLMRAAQMIEKTGRLTARDLDRETAFLAVRANPAHRDAWLVNRLIARFMPDDFVSAYVFDKQGFYAFYEAQGENYRRFIVDTLKNDYLSGKAALREKLYGLRD